MRLIDADKFLEYLIFSKHIDSLKCGEVKKAVEMCEVKPPTVCDIEKIRAEIEQFVGVSIHDVEVIAKNDVLQILDKYAEQEPTSPCYLCRYDYLDGVCGDCPAMAKGGE